MFSHQGIDSFVNVKCQGSGFMFQGLGVAQARPFQAPQKLRWILRILRVPICLYAPSHGNCGAITNYGHAGFLLSQ